MSNTFNNLSKPRLILTALFMKPPFKGLISPQGCLVPCACAGCLVLCACVQVVWFHARVHVGSVCGENGTSFPQDTGTVFVTDSHAQMGPSGMVWESSATGLGRTGQPKSQANRKALQGPYKAL